MHKVILTAAMYFTILTASAQHIADCISIESLSSNRVSYFYGEPIKLFFSVENSANEVKRYWAPATGVNVKIELLNLNDKKKPSTSFYSSSSGHMRQEWSQQVPDERNSYDPGEAWFLEYIVASEFESNKLIDQYCPFQINQYNQVIPVGRYRFSVIYTLLPSRQVVTTFHDFEITDVPASERGVFNKYLLALKYACETHPVRGDGSYSVNHPNSLQSVVNAYPNSRYAQHAMHIAADWVYGYMPNDNAAASLLKEYCNYLGPLKYRHISLQNSH